MELGDILNAAQIGHDPLRARMQGRFSNGKNEIAIPLIGSNPLVLILQINPNQNHMSQNNEICHRKLAHRKGKRGGGDKLDNVQKL